MGSSNIEELEKCIAYTARKRKKLFESAQEICSTLASGIVSEVKNVKSDTPLEFLGFRPIIIRRLREEGINTLDDLLSRAWIEIGKIPGFGNKKIEEITQALASHGIFKK
jgi:DNA-directed RNA polymerase alpha subunit